MESSEDENKHEYIPLLLKEKEIDSFKYADDDDEGTELKGEKNADDSVEETEMKQKKPPDEGTELKEKKTADDSIARTDENEAKTEQSTTHKVTPMQSGESQTDTEIYRTILKQMDKMYTDCMDVDFPDGKRLIQKLSDGSIPANHIKQISGHKNVNSINNYSKLNNVQNRQISDILSNKSTKSSSTVVCNPDHASTSGPVGINCIPQVFFSLIQIFMAM
ncbi:uncharacterized protein LOC128556233 [Mercenaria mercenaria]|uniref:uncharacterized protein LOC128556233 n=1 Tax=Mercenaria mercenaria TaxID=6596 RepID=UPI00234F4E63|nr:uncharacterized protein LOC128556233 [Mercenaria mercenaria]